MQVHGIKEATLAFTALGASVSRWTLMNDSSKSEPHFSPVLLLAWTLMVKAPNSRHAVGFAQI